MISGHRPPKKPLGEISASEEDADKLAASERHTEDCRSRLVECERRLKQAHDFLALLKTRGDDPAVAQYSREEHDRLATDMANASNEERELQCEISSLKAEIEAEEVVQAAAKERLAMLLDDSQGSIWMVTTVGIPREWRLGGKPEEPAELSASQQEESQEARQHDDDDDTDNDDDVFGEIPKDPEDEEVLDPVVHLINPEGVCVGPDGSIYVTDSIHSCVRKISAAGRVTNMAGDGKRGQRDGRAQVAHFSDADKALPAQFCHPRGILVDDAGNLFVCDTENHTVRGISQEGQVSTLAGSSGKAGFKDGPALAGAAFCQPWACCRGLLNGEEALFVADSGNHCIRAVSTEGGVGVVKTIFGSPTRSGKGANELNFPWSLCYNGSLLYVGDKYNLRIVVFSPDDPATARVLTDAWPWASRFAPRGFASNTDGTLFMTSSFGGMIWKYDPPGSMEVLFGQSGGEDGAEFKVVLPQKIAGSGLRSYRDGRAEFAEFMFPAGIAVDLNGSLLVADHGNHILRRLRTLREAEVKAKLRKMLEDMNNRGIRMCYQLWAMNVTVHEPLEPLEVVMLLTLGTLSSEVSTQDSTSRQDSPLVAFHPSAPPAPTDAPQHDEGHGGVRGHTNESQALRVIVEALASCLEWRVVKTRQEVAHVHYADDYPAAITEEELAERVAEAREIFEKFDVDGSGSIDARELKDALDAADMDVSNEEVLELLAQYDSKQTGEVGFDDFCRMQGILIPEAEGKAEEPAQDKKPPASATSTSAESTGGSSRPTTQVHTASASKTAASSASKPKTGASGASSTKPAAVKRGGAVKGGAAKGGATKGGAVQGAATKGAAATKAKATDAPSRSKASSGKAPAAAAKPKPHA